MLSFMDHIKIKFRHFILPQEILIQLAQPHQTILDIGCGLGTFLMSLDAEKKNLKGVDVCSATVNKAQKILVQQGKTNIDIAHFNGDPTTISNWEHYDMIFLNDVLHHIHPKEQFNFLMKIHKKMRKGSLLVLKDIDASSPLVFFNKLHDLVVNRQKSYERPLAEYIEWCQKLGFLLDNVMKVRKLVYPHFIMVMTKI
ncbi:MAG: class I SAM-dependent methyltransferase [Alphaproteobacteria bacterium]|nr:class I SAM-dependent methyltransferase [Alphaproteobacteria bacterium]